MFAFSAFLLTASVSSFAEETQIDLQIAATSDSYRQNHEKNQMEHYDSKVTLGGNYTYIHLKPKGNASFSGSLGGLQALYEFTPMNRFYGGVLFNYRQGSASGDDGRRDLLFFDAEERLGYTFSLCEDSCFFTLYSGFGFHYSGQNLKPDVGQSVRFNYNEFYFPLGFLFGYDVNSWFDIGLNFSWKAQVFPTVAIIPIKGANWDLAYRFLNFYVSVPLTFTLTEDKRFLLTVNPFYEHWNDGRSTAELSTGVTLGLPSNDYNYGGCDINLSYRF